MAPQPLVVLPPGVLGCMATAQPEEPLGQQQVDHHGQVDDERDELEGADAVRQLVDLIGDQGGGGDEREVLGPALVEPEAHHLGPLERGEGEEHEGQDAQVCRRVLEGPAEVAEEAARLGRTGGPARQIVHDVLVVVMEGLVVRGEGEQRDGQPDEHNDMDGAVDGNEAQDVAVAEGGAAQGQFDLVPLLDPLPRRVLRRAFAGPSRRSAGNGASAPVRPRRPPARRRA